MDRVESVALQRSVPDGRPVIVDATGVPLLSLWPLIQVHVAVPGHAEHLFMLAGPKGAAARLVVPQYGFEHRDSELWDWFGTQLFAPAPSDPSVVDDASPYRGLLAYIPSDTALFLGRERETEHLVNRLVLEPFVAVVGPSGVGKSSFVNAGVVPAMTGWHSVTTRPGRTPLRQLLAQLGLSESVDLAPADLAGDVARRQEADQDGLIVVVDQFEELFTLGCADDERQRFAQVLLALGSDAGRKLRVIITLRDDFLIRAQQLPGFDAMLARGLHLLGPMNAEALSRVIVEPARRLGYEFDDPSLPERMVAEAADTPAAVALISFAASRLWELRDRHFRQLPRKAYEAIGGVAGALARHADETVEALSTSERTVVRTMFRHLVTFEGTRAVLLRDELEQLLGGGAEGRRVIERLISSRLVISAESERGDGTVEIIHEALVSAWPRLAEWRREDAEAHVSRPAAHRREAVGRSRTGLGAFLARRRARRVSALAQAQRVGGHDGGGRVRCGQRRRIRARATHPNRSRRHRAARCIGSSSACRSQSRDPTLRAERRSSCCWTQPSTAVGC